MEYDEDIPLLEDSVSLGDKIEPPIYSAVFNLANATIGSGN